MGILLILWKSRQVALAGFDFGGMNACSPRASPFTVSSRWIPGQVLQGFLWILHTTLFKLKVFLSHSAHSLEIQLICMDGSEKKAFGVLLESNDDERLMTPRLNRRKLMNGFSLVLSSQPDNFLRFPSRRRRNPRKTRQSSFPPLLPKNEGGRREGNGEKNNYTSNTHQFYGILEKFLHFL